MDPGEAPPFTITQDLPPYRAVLAVDAKGFTEQPGSTHQTISVLILRLVGEAFDLSGLCEAWKKPPFWESTGDGFAMGVPTHALPHLVHPLLNNLQAILSRHNRQTYAGNAQIRLRLSLHVGPLPEDPTNPHLGGNGAARNDTHRLLDSTQVKAILAAASPHTTSVAAILSDRVFQDVVEAGYAGRHPHHFVEVAATVPGKQFAQRAWLYIPEPSGNLVTVDGRTGQETTTDSPVAASPSPSSPSSPEPGSAPEHTGAPRVRNNHGQVATVVHGGMHQDNRARPQ